jgi:hypothetical protein
MSPVWKSAYLGMEQWTTWDHALQQTHSLLEVGGLLCKVLFRNITGQPVGDAESPLIISTWESDSTSTSARKRIWKSGDLMTDYPNPDSVRVFVDNVELKKTYNTKTITSNNEFYVEVQDNLVGYNDNVSIYLNRGYSTTGHTIGYSYTTRAKSIMDSNLQPIADTSSYRSLFGFTQFLDPQFTFREMSFPHCMMISFPPPLLNTVFANLGSSEQWQGRCWTLGDTPLHEFDVLYRVSDNRYFEIRDYEPNVIMYQGNWKLMTQSFTVTEISPTDTIRSFPLI